MPRYIRTLSFYITALRKNFTLLILYQCIHPFCSCDFTPVVSRHVYSLRMFLLHSSCMKYSTNYANIPPASTAEYGTTLRPSSTNWVRDSHICYPRSSCMKYIFHLLLFLWLFPSSGVAAIVVDRLFPVSPVSFIALMFCI